LHGSHDPLEGRETADELLVNSAEPSSRIEREPLVVHIATNGGCMNDWTESEWFHAWLKLARDGSAV
jgi:hypothetical protein